MSFKFRFMDKIVAVFLIMTIMAIAAGAVLAGKFKKSWEDKTYYKSVYKEYIDVGTKVVIKDIGIQIGRVIETIITENNEIVVTYFVYDNYLDKIREDSIAYLDAGFMGLTGKKLAISIGNKNLPKVENNRVIPSNQSLEGLTMISAASPDKPTDQIGSLLTNVTNLTGNLATLMEPKGPLYGTMRNVETMTYRLAQADGFIQPVVGDANFKQISGMMVSMNSSLDNVSQMMAEVKTLMNNDVNIFAKTQMKRVDILLETSFKKIDSMMNQMDYMMTFVGSMLQSFTQQTNPMLKDASGFMRKNLANMNEKLNGILGQAEKTANSLMSGTRQNFGSYMDNLDKILKTVKDVVLRIDNLMQRVESMPLLPDAKPVTNTNVDLENRGFENK